MLYGANTLKPPTSLINMTTITPYGVLKSTALLIVNNTDVFNHSSTSSINNKALMINHDITSNTSAINY